MKWIYIFSVMILIFIQLTRCERVRTDRENKQKMLDALLDPSVYDPRVRPAGIQSKDSAVVVNASIYILDIRREDPYLKDFTVQCYFRQKWTDRRLAFADADETMHVNDPSRVWIPDLFIVNEVSSRLHDTIVPNRFIYLSKTGDVLMSVRVSALMKCNTNLQFFPHDQQVCTIEIESYGHSASELLLQWDTAPHNSGISKNISHDKFIVVDFQTRKSLHAFMREGAKVEYSVLYVDLMFSRIFSPYLWSLYLPYMILVILSWGSFCIHPKKILLRLAFLFFTLILLVHLSPDVNYLRNDVYHVTALDFWVIGSFSFLLAAFMEYVYIYNLFVKEQDDVSELEANDLEDGKMETKDKTDISIKSLKQSFLSKNYWKSCGKNPVETDKFCRNVLFPVAFLVFNIIYWSVCYSGQCSTLKEWHLA